MQDNTLACHATAGNYNNSCCYTTLYSSTNVDCPIQYAHRHGLSAGGLLGAVAGGGRRRPLRCGAGILVAACGAGIFSLYILFAGLCFISKIVEYQMLTQRVRLSVPPVRRACRMLTLTRRFIFSVRNIASSFKPVCVPHSKKFSPALMQG